MSAQTPTLAGCPAEIICLICQQLCPHCTESNASVRDLANFSLTCGRYREIAEPFLYHSLRLADGITYGTPELTTDEHVASVVHKLITRPKLAAGVRKLVLDPFLWRVPKLNAPDTIRIFQAVMNDGKLDPSVAFPDILDPPTGAPPDGVALYEAAINGRDISSDPNVRPCMASLWQLYKNFANTERYKLLDSTWQTHGERDWLTFMTFVTLMYTRNVQYLTLMLTDEMRFPGLEIGSLPRLKAVWISFSILEGSFKQPGFVAALLAGAPALEKLYLERVSSVGQPLDIEIGPYNNIKKLLLEPDWPLSKTGRFEKLFPLFPAMTSFAWVWRYFDYEPSACIEAVRIIHQHGRGLEEVGLELCPPVPDGGDNSSDLQEVSLREMDNLRKLSLGLWCLCRSGRSKEDIKEAGVRRWEVFLPPSLEHLAIQVVHCPRGWTPCTLLSLVGLSEHLPALVPKLRTITAYCGVQSINMRELKTDFEKHNIEFVMIQADLWNCFL